MTIKLIAHRYQSCRWFQRLTRWLWRRRKFGRRPSRVLRVRGDLCRWCIAHGSSRYRVGWGDAAHNRMNFGRRRDKGIDPSWRSSKSVTSSINTAKRLEVRATGVVCCWTAVSVRVTSCSWISLPLDDGDLEAGGCLLVGYGCCLSESNFLDRIPKNSPGILLLSDFYEFKQLLLLRNTIHTPSTQKAREHTRA